MAGQQCSERLCPLLVMLLLTFLPLLLTADLITDEEAAILAKTPKTIFCFSRTFEDLTCFWDEPEEATRMDGTHHFFYTYKGEITRECKLISVKHSGGGARHICILPSDNIYLFTELYIEVLDIVSNLTTLSQNLSVETVGLIAPPVNIKAEWPKVTGQLNVTWDPPPISYDDFLTYEVLYRVEGSRQPPSRIKVMKSHTCQLMGLSPGKQYQIQVRTKPDGISLDGLWGTLSPTVLAETPHLSEEINLHCITPDLCRVHCQWEWKAVEPGHPHNLLYWAEDNNTSTRIKWLSRVKDKKRLSWRISNMFPRIPDNCWRCDQEAADFRIYGGNPRSWSLYGERTQVWHKCEEEEEKAKLQYHSHSHACSFQPSNNSYVSILVTVIQNQSQQKFNYFKEPFKLHQVVFTAPPKIVQVTVDRRMLKLEWVSLLEELAEHMVYEIRYAAEDTLNWKVRHVQYSTSEILDLVFGGDYCLQLRAQPDGKKFKGGWSAWSEAVCIQVPPGTGSTILSVAVALLLCTGLVLVLGCLSTFSVKRKLWPPIPNLHHALDGFLEDNCKQQQQQQQQANAFFCNKILEDTPLTCLLEVLSEMPPETPSYRFLPDSISIGQAEWDSQLSSHQHYIVLRPSSPHGSHHENEYFDGTNEGCDNHRIPVEHNPHEASEPHAQLGSFTLFSGSFSAPETKEERSWEASEEMSTCPTHLSNQSYLLMG